MKKTEIIKKLKKFNKILKPIIKQLFDNCLGIILIIYLLIEAIVLVFILIIVIIIDETITWWSNYIRSFEPEIEDKLIPLEAPKIYERRREFLVKYLHPKIISILDYLVSKKRDKILREKIRIIKYRVTIFLIILLLLWLYDQIRYYNPIEF